MASAANLRLKGSRFYFRRKIPYNLRARFGRSEIVRSLQTGERRTATARARVVWLQMERVFETVLQEPTLRREQIDRLLKNAAADIAWADEIRPARNGSIFDHHGSPPLTPTHWFWKARRRPGEGNWRGTTSPLFKGWHIVARIGWA